ncbi:hypothetical protein OG897_21790 [Streptomyces sp. NBC_00237]|uniref:acyl-CoA dehydrogenase family protein n=1 Tax=Streptomyces sp. NBC_00237 TaxID=2975687 RepID=UPI0022501A5E|nr:acyl-CoA dehydrogenase [Streptomyces sp. NBC_00237]MCX5204072.1 hypothetical protein [Streptomyces sp. NBC_00237]
MGPHGHATETPLTPAELLRRAREAAALGAKVRELAATELLTKRAAAAKAAAEKEKADLAAREAVAAAPRLFGDDELVSELVNIPLAKLERDAKPVTAARAKEVVEGLRQSVERPRVRRRRSSVSKMAAKHKARIDTDHGPRVCFEARIERENRKPLVARFGGIPLYRQRSAKIADRRPTWVDYPHKELVTRLLADTCEICGHHGDVQVHHIRALADLAHAGWPPSDWTRVMLDTLPGITVTLLPDRIGSPVDHCVTSFETVRLPRTALLQGEHGRLTADGTFTSEVGSPRKRFLHAIRRVTVGKLCMSASTLGGSRAALAIAVRYAYQRHISGPVAGQRVPLAAHRSHHSRLLAGTATAYAMTFLHRAVTERWITHTPANRAETERLVAVAKGWITWQARALTTESRERCGARALFPVNGLAEFTANADGAITAEGDNLAVWCKAGAEMIFGHPAAPAAGPATGKEALTDPAFLRRALSVAERHWHLAARRDIRTGTGDALGRWNHASAPALALVEAYTLGQAADAFAAASAQVAHADTRTVLNDLQALFLLDRLAPLSGLLLTEHALTTDQVRAIPDTLRDLTARLAPHLAPLTEAFDVPEEHLASLPMLTPHTSPRTY